MTDYDSDSDDNYDNDNDTVMTSLRQLLQYYLFSNTDDTTIILCKSYSSNYESVLTIRVRDKHNVIK